MQGKPIDPFAARRSYLHCPKCGKQVKRVFRSDAVGYPQAYVTVSCPCGWEYQFQAMHSDLRKGTS